MEQKSQHNFLPCWEFKPQPLVSRLQLNGPFLIKFKPIRHIIQQTAVFKDALCISKVLSFTNFAVFHCILVITVDCMTLKENLIDIEVSIKFANLIFHMSTLSLMSMYACHV